MWAATNLCISLSSRATMKFKNIRKKKKKERKEKEKKGRKGGQERERK